MVRELQQKAFCGCQVRKEALRSRALPNLEIAPTQNHTEEYQCYIKEMTQLSFLVFMGEEQKEIVIFNIFKKGI